MSARRSTRRLSALAAAAFATVALQAPDAAADAPAPVAAERIICLEPRPAPSDAPGPDPLWESLRRGLFAACVAYRAGGISAAEYRATLEAYPALVITLGGMQALASAGHATPNNRRAMAALCAIYAANGPAARMLTPLSTICTDDISLLNN